MANSNQHAEWLSLVEVSGPFLSLTVLNQAFTFGLDAHDADLYRSVKEAYAEWEDNPASSIHTAWIRFLVRDILGYPDAIIGQAQAIPEAAVAVLELQGERIRPDLVILDPDDPRKVKLPLMVWPRSQKLEAPAAGSSWSASPHTRMQVLLQNTGMQAGFVTNGAQWTLVHVRKGEPTGFATWQTLLLTEEKLLLQSFRGILGVERSIGSPAGESLYDLLDKSAQDQEEVTKELGRQVREAVEVFVNAMDRLDQDSGRKLLADWDAKTIYNGALTVMMRLIFLLCAEARDLIDQRALYVEYYSVSALNDQLVELATQTGEDVLEHRHDAWMRLLSTFRIIHGGCNHEDINMPAYGGSLFEPAKYPFLEQCRINNRVVLHLLDALQFLEIRVGASRERRRLSFRALGVEQIGHVYEGLLDHTAVRAAEPFIGLTGKDTEEEEIALSALEANRALLGKFFDKQKIKVSGNADRLLQQPPNMMKASRLRVACGTDDLLFGRALPFVNIIREDSLEHIQVFPERSIYVTNGEDRRSSGTHYTPVSLTEEVVRYALEPLVYIGPADGKPKSEWKLRGAPEIIDLKVCDMAMGSGAFLVQTCRYLSARLVEAWGIALETAKRPLGFSATGEYFTVGEKADKVKAHGTLIETPLGNIALASPSSELIAESAEERLAQALRIVADRCLYGVDRNPMAVEMAKLSLWLTTMQRDKPFTFLDHALKVGDSLLGVSDRQLEGMTMSPSTETGSMLLDWVPGKLAEVRRYRNEISKIPSHDPASVGRKAELDRAARINGERLHAAADALLVFELARLSKKPFSIEEWDGLLTALREDADTVGDGVNGIRQHLGRKPMNWQIEFSDVFQAGGFSAIVGNPPFIGGQKITGVLGTDYRDYLVENVGNGVRGSADLCAYFFLRAKSLLREGGTLAFLATNTICQGDTREVGLDQLVTGGSTIFRADKSTKWPGTANLEISKVWIRNGSWSGDRLLGGEPVCDISPFLDDGTSSGKPYLLTANEGLSFIGSYVLGMGFVLEPDAAHALIVSDADSSKVLFPYLNGEDLNSRPDQSASRWVINFRDWPLGRLGQKLPLSQEPIERAVASADPRRFEQSALSADSRWHASDDEARKKWLQIGVVPTDYPREVAADYPDVLKLIELNVKSERQSQNPSGEYRLRYPLPQRWWHYAEKRPDLYRTIAPLTRFLVRARVSQFHSFAWVLPDIVVSEQLVVIASDRPAMFAVVQSAIHQVFTAQNASSLETRQRYTPSDCFETFPLPCLTDELDERGLALERCRVTASSAHNVGLTNLVHRVNDHLINTSEISALRHAIVANDQAVCQAYGWTDIHLDHDFIGSGKNRRFDISERDRNEVLRRLMKLNRLRYDQEVKAGLHDRARPRSHNGNASDAQPVDDLTMPSLNLFSEQMTFGEVQS